VGYGQRLRVQRNADVRVLKAQLDLIAEAVYATRFTSPLWALAIAFLASDQFGYFGNTPFSICLIVPVAVSIAMGIAWFIVAKYRNDVGDHSEPERVQPWFMRFVSMQVAVSAIWSLVAWTLWMPGNPLNHLFLAVCLVCVVSGLLVSRATHLDMFIAGLAPVGLLAFVRFALGDGAIDYVIATLLPIYAMQLIHDGRRLTQRLDGDSRLRFEVEDLARELEETRDDALRKRYEAETANASKTAFLANMSHELRTPLNAILGFSEIIEKECLGAVGSPKYKEYAGDIHSSGSHLLSLINDLLDVAKIEAGKMDIEPEVLDTRKTLESALKLVQAKARERRQEFAIEVAADTPDLYADERAFKQVLINLVSNAVKFTPIGGRVAVVASRTHGGEFQMMVEDNGPGISSDKIDRIFKPFSQVDNRYDRQAGGTGLGLALVRGLAELHGGRAWLESEQGKGCRAYVVLPNQANAPKKIENVAA
jgi:two-component system cell cycle sensor histidine kinase PleC